MRQRIWRTLDQLAEWSRFLIPPVFLIVLCYVAFILHDVLRARLADESAETIREARAVITETHETLAVLRKSADAQSGYIEATSRRSADIALRTQLAVKHFDEAIVKLGDQGHETLKSANATITQLNTSIEDIRKDSKRAIDAVEDAGEAAAFAGEQIGYAAKTLNATTQALAPGAAVAIGDLVATTTKAQEIMDDPRVDQMLDGVAKMPQLVEATTVGVQEATKTVQCGRRGFWGLLMGCK